MMSRSRRLAASITTTPLDITDIVDTAADAHHACCVQEMLYCGAAYHPEAVAAEDQEPTCAECSEIREQMGCPPRRPTHQHCPVHPSGRRCPDR